MIHKFSFIKKLFLIFLSFNGISILAQDFSQDFEMHDLQEIKGNNISFFPKSEIDVCIKNCLENKQCIAFQFFRSNKQCWLKDNISESSDKNLDSLYGKKYSPNSKYLIQLLKHLEMIRQYPSSREARLSRPQGTVTLSIVIYRNGSVKSTEIVKSSGSNLLDTHSLLSVGKTSFPPFLDDQFPGEITHTFQSSLEYKIE